MISAPSLVIEGLTKQFCPLRAVDDLSFEVRPPRAGGRGLTTLRRDIG